MRFGNTIIWERKQVALGSGQVEQLTIFENKHLFSIWSYSWGSVGDQMRFHTHAFHSVAVTLWGSYVEQVLTDGDEEWTNTHGFTLAQGSRMKRVAQPWHPRYLPRDYCHRIISSDGARTLVFAGPWAETWKEYFPDTNKWVTYTWGRKKVD